MTATEPAVRDNPDEHRFEIAVDGGVLAGFTAYADDADRRIFYHTEIGPEFGGRGLAGVLVRDAVAATRAAGRRIVPVCSYVRRWLGTHAEEAGVAALVDPVTPEALALVRHLVD